MRVLWLSGLVVLLDQATKLLVLQTMYLGQQIPLIGDWLKFTYTENPGMAFGITFGPKAMVTVFSIIATVLITMYLIKVRRGYFPYRAGLGLILGGAVGNIIDRVFYGALFGDDTLFVGRVVDFIHVNVWSGFIPESIPIIGGTYLSLFPIWNVADMAIVCGVVAILSFQQRFHLHELGSSQQPSEGAATETVGYFPPSQHDPEHIQAELPSTDDDHEMADDVETKGGVIQIDPASNRSGRERPDIRKSL
jgi:signal peptidase II